MKSPKRLRNVLLRTKAILITVSILLLMQPITFEENQNADLEEISDFVTMQNSIDNSKSHNQVVVTIEEQRLNTSSINTSSMTTIVTSISSQNNSISNVRLSRIQESIPNLVFNDHNNNNNNDHTNNNEDSSDSTSNNNYYFAYKFRNHGLGSNFMNMFVRMMFMQEEHNRSLIAIESEFGYRRNASVGALSGYFRPTFPVVDRIDQHAILESLNGGINVSEFTPDFFSTQPSHDPSIRIWMLGHHQYKWQAYRWYAKLKPPGPFYEKFLKYACPHLQLNNETRKEVQDYKKEHGIPSFSVQDQQQTASVAFHVRRTDKLDRESRLYKGIEYVNKLLSIVGGGTTTRTKIQDCFIATDDERVVEEMELALQQANVTCRTYSLSKGQLKKSTRTTTEETIRLITELDIMSHTTYFVGTFNSNVGGLVGILRGCNQPNQTHFGMSYGVDRDTWSFKWV